MQISGRSGGASVLTSGMVTAFFGAPIELELTDGTWRFSLSLSFESDAEREGLDVRSTLSEHGMALVCVNFDGADGRGSASPVLCGRKGEAFVFVHFRVFRFGNTTDRTVHYTFYSAERNVLDFDPWLP